MKSKGLCGETGHEKQLKTGEGAKNREKWEKERIVCPVWEDVTLFITVCRNN